ncbi:hypothetical protein [Embleya sp. AB8]|uniref:hypothetical protein n=1 Tax=Embleya sp. AB8 TaxID=3156304 RepID=UPI003C76269B
MIPIQAVLFLSYAVGATFALASARQLQAWERRAAGRRAPAELAVRIRARTANPYLCLTVLFAAVLLVPTGVFMLWQNPSWQTMHSAHRHTDVWAGFVLVYAGGCVLAVLAGFLAGQALVLVGAAYWVFVQAVAAWFVMFLILVHGADGSGYRRVLTTNSHDFATWSRRGVGRNVLDFANSGTMFALVFLGGPVLLLLFLTEISWLAEGWRLPGADAERKVPKPVAVAIAAAGVHGLPFVGALLASGLIRMCGWPLGLLLFAPIAATTLLWRRSPVRTLYPLVGIPAGHWRDGEDFAAVPPEQPASEQPASEQQPLAAELVAAVTAVLDRRAAPPSR